MHWRLLYFKCGWWGYFPFVRSYSQWSPLHSVEKCLQFSRTGCTEWFCQLVFFFVKHFIYPPVGRRHRSRVCCQHQRSWSGDPFVFGHGWDFSFWERRGRDSGLAVHPHCVCSVSPSKAQERDKNRCANQTEMRSCRASPGPRTSDRRCCITLARLAKP